MELTPKEKAKELVDFHNSMLINYIQNEFAIRDQHHINIYFSLKNLNLKQI